MSATTLRKIGEKLKKARLEKGMTQAEVAKKAGIGTNRYAVVERGEAENITINKLEKIVKALGIKGSDILPF
ncbi:MAG TPA: helix-turn-helix transcriptional regulator [Candidatus Saccharimonadales bacterium]